MNNKNILVFIIFLLLISSVHAFDLTPSETEKSTCPSSTILLNTNVVGTGNFNVNVEGTAAKWATIVPQGFSLNNEAKLIYIYVTPKFDTNPGFYSLNLIITNTINNEIKNVNYKINVPDCHNLIVTGIKSKEVCGCNSDTYNFTISNNGIYQEAYKIEVTGKAAPWIKLSQYDLSLLPEQSKTIYGLLNAPCGSDFGENDFTITIRSLTSNTIASFDSNVIVNSCFDFNENVDKELVNMCEHASEVISITINNLAQLDNEFDLAITGPAWANLHLTKLDLKPKESGVVNLILTPDYKVQGNFDVNVNIKSQQSKINKDEKFKINVRACNDISLELLTREDKICVGSKKTYEANVKNLGEFEKEFRIESDQGWIKPSEVIFTLSPKQSKKINLEFNPSENLTAQKYKINFRVLALDSSRISSEDSFDLDLVSRESCYKPQLEAENSVDVNADSSATTGITIKNVGAELAVYELGITGNANSFAQLNPSTLTIEPGKSEITYLYIAPPYNTKSGEYKANILVNLKNSGVLESKTIIINVNEGGSSIPGSSLWNKLLSFIKKFNLNDKISSPEPLIDLNRETLISKNVKFIFGNETHALNILEIKNSTVTLSIESEPIFILLDLNETENVDLNKDGKNDLILTLKGFDKDGNPLISVVKESEVKENSFLNSLNNVKDAIYKYKFPLLVGIIIVIAIILIFTTKAYKKLINYIEEDSDEDEIEPLRIGRYIFLVIILIVLFWFFRIYPEKIIWILTYLNMYKYYIISGLIILILLILIISYWKQVIDFFEEEQPKKRKR
ncbi:MAG: hypothetical protein AABX61_00725 [Nanoarchaeota archaeon]